MVLAMRIFVLMAMFSLTVSAQVPPKLTPEQVREGFHVFCGEIQSTYAYFDLKTTRWDQVEGLYEADLGRVQTRGELIALLERAINELYDDHAQLTVNAATSLMLVPSGTDLWAEWVGAVPTVVEVRRDSDAERAGIQPGAVVLSINDVPIAQAAEQLIGRAVAKDDLSVRNWALRHALAGRHGEVRRLEALQGHRKRIFVLPAKRTSGNREEPITFRRIAGEIGYIRINDALGDGATVAAFDRALSELRDTRGMVIDLRDTPSGGNSMVARGILGRFVSRETGYQKHVLAAEERETGIRRSWIELVSPRGRFHYDKQVAVLIGRWTGSMGEGIAIALDAFGKTTVGGPMAQLLGATYRIDLPNSKIGVNVPAERLYHVDGRPREAYQPTISVSGASGAADKVLDAAVDAIMSTAGHVE